VSAFYLVGSIALDAFDPRFSDIDFVAVASRKPAPGDLERLKKLHRALARRYPRWKMEGCYLQPGDLGCFEGDVEPFPALHDGRLGLSNRFELNGVTWWVLKQRGLALFGPPPQSLPIQVDWERLIARMRENLNTYWAGWTRWTRQPRRMVLLLSDWGIQWTVLGVLRQFYTFRENDITSKTAAGEYALACLPARWQPLVREAINLRQGDPARSYRSRLGRAIDARRFLKYIIRECKNL